MDVVTNTRGQAVRLHENFPAIPASVLGLKYHAGL